jgi:PTS system nitrogen regulatory IIA component
VDAISSQHLPTLPASRRVGKTMTISDFLSQPNVVVDIRASDKSQLVRELAQKAATALNLPLDLIASELLKREELGSTGIGSGIAIPHARIRAIVKPFGLVAKLKQPIDFDAIDGQSVDLVFVLLLPASPDGDQLGALASVARKLRTPMAVARMRQAKGSNELYAAIVE